jgi:hypothetical protein
MYSRCPARSRVLLALTAVVAVVVVACGSDESPAGPGATDGSTTPAVATDQQVPADLRELAPADLARLICDADTDDDEGEELGRIENPAIYEASGLVASAKNPGVLWTHNDSTRETAVYAMATDGTDLGEWQVTGGDARNWEDLAGWYDAATDQHYLLLADIGDNDSVRNSIAVYVVPEPVVDAEVGGGGTTEPAVAYKLDYPDGAHDAESFFVDPATGDWYVLTKGWGTGISQVFRAASPVAGDTTTLEDTGVTVNFKDLGSYATAADANGVVVVRTYEEIAVWGLDGAPAEVLARPPCTGPSPYEAQGEAVALAPDRSGYFTVSEGAGARIWWVPFSL